MDNDTQLSMTGHPHVHGEHIAQAADTHTAPRGRRGRHTSNHSGDSDGKTTPLRAARDDRDRNTFLCGKSGDRWACIQQMLQALSWIHRIRRPKYQKHTQIGARLENESPWNVKKRRAIVPFRGSPLTVVSMQDTVDSVRRQPRVFASLKQRAQPQLLLPTVLKYSTPSIQATYCL